MSRDHDRIVALEKKLDDAEADIFALVHLLRYIIGTTPGVTRAELDGLLRNAKNATLGKTIQANAQARVDAKLPKWIPALERLVKDFQDVLPEDASR